MQQKNFGSFASAYWKTIIWAIIIAIGLFTPGDKLPDRRLFQIENLDKIVHLIIFGFLQFLILLDMELNKVIITKKLIILSLLISISYGIFTELIQFFMISKRKASVSDLFSDITGIMLALGVFFLLRRFINQWLRLK